MLGTAERAKVEENAVGVKQGHRAGTGTVHGQPRSKSSQCKKAAELLQMSNCKSYDDLPLFLNASLTAQVLGVSPSTAYELMHEPGFPVLRVGSRMVVPKEKFTQWVDAQFGGAK